MNPDRWPELLVKLVDGVATPAEREEAMRLATADPARRAELEEHMAIKAITDGWVERLEHDRFQDHVQGSRVAQVEAGLGGALFVGGLAILAAGGLWAAWQDIEAPLWLKIGLSTLAAGSVLLLGATIRWRWQVSRHDPYNEVIR